MSGSTLEIVSEKLTDENNRSESGSKLSEFAENVLTCYGSNYDSETYNLVNVFLRLLCGKRLQIGPSIFGDLHGELYTSREPLFQLF